MLYIGNYLSYKPRNDFCIYKTAESESIFIELINTKKSNVVIGANYGHPNMDLDESNLLLDKISKENKSIFLLGDFNVDLLKYDHHAPANEFIDSLFSHMFLPPIIQSSTVTYISKTLIVTYFIILLVLILFLETSLPQFLIISHNLLLHLTLFLTHL